MTVHTPYRQKNWPTAPSILGRKAIGSMPFLAPTDFFWGGYRPRHPHPTCLAPWVATLTGRDSPVVVGGIGISIVGALVATIIGHISISRFTSLPTIDAKTCIMPAFLATFGSVMLALYLIGTPFGLNHLLLSFIIVIAWYFAIVIARAAS